MLISLQDQALILGFTALAGIFGAFIGVERRRAEKPMGTRTHALVAAASALIVSLGSAVNEAHNLGDPTRALHAVITGIGFLGAGAIYGGTKRPATGLTTAATVFMTAAIGVATGLGAPLAGFGVTLLTLATLRLMPGGGKPGALSD